MEVSEIYQQRDILLMHGTKLKGGAHPPNCIAPGASVIQRIDQTINSDTSISCFSFSQGDTCCNLWSPVGLILKSGIIKAADKFDLGSYSTDDCHRECDAIEGVTIEEQVHSAIEYRGATTYNEFLITLYQELGIYICFDDVDYLVSQIGNIDNFFKESRYLDLPYFSLRAGNIHEYSPPGYPYADPDLLITISDIKKKYKA
jgi:hypothetical protein